MHYKLFKILIIYIPLNFNSYMILGFKPKESDETLENISNLVKHLKKYILVNNSYSIINYNNSNSIKNNANFKKRIMDSMTWEFNPKKKSESIYFDSEFRGIYFISFESMKEEIYFIELIIRVFSHYGVANVANKFVGIIFELNNKYKQNRRKAYRIKKNRIFFIIIISEFPYRIWGLWSYNNEYYKKTKAPLIAFGELWSNNNNKE